MPPLSVVSPLSSTFSPFGPVPPSSTRAPATPSTTPPSAGTSLPTLIVSAPAPVLIVVWALVEATRIVSLPLPSRTLSTSIVP